VVTPVIDQLPPVEPPRSDEMGDSAGSHSVGTHGADDQSTREYRIGDDLRKIHWRSSARTGALMVRQEERPWRGQSTVLLDVRSIAHAEAPITGAGAMPQDPRVSSSFEWAVSAVASIGSHLLVRGRELTLLGDPADDRLRVGNSNLLANHLASARTLGHPDLTVQGGTIRSAVRDSSLVAVLGKVDPNSLRMLADAHPRGRSSPAFAILLDVDTWRDPEAAANPSLDASAAVLRNAGWRVATVRHGDTTALAWGLLLSGYASAARGSAVIR
jgi:uncharacterized protein (DUF58 family)